MVIIAASTYDREHAHRTGEELVKAFQHPAAADLDFARQPISANVRDIEL